MKKKMNKNGKLTIEIEYGEELWQKIQYALWKLSESERSWLSPEEWHNCWIDFTQGD